MLINVLLCSWFHYTRLCTGMDEARTLVYALCSYNVSPVSPPLLHVWLLINVVFYCWFYYIWLCTGMDEARALVHALCSSNVSRVSLLCSMFQCFNFFVGWGHAQGMRLATRPVYAACGVAFVAGVTGARWRCPKRLYAHKQCTRAIQNNNLLLQIASNKHARLQQGIKGKA